MLIPRRTLRVRAQSLTQTVHTHIYVSCLHLPVSTSRLNWIMPRIRGIGSVSITRRTKNIKASAHLPILPWSLLWRNYAFHASCLFAEFQKELLATVQKFRVTPVRFRFDKRSGRPCYDDEYKVYWIFRRFGRWFSSWTYKKTLYTTPCFNRHSFEAVCQLTPSLAALLSNSYIRIRWFCVLPVLISKLKPKINGRAMQVSAPLTFVTE